MRLIDADELITAFPCGESVRTESVRATINHMPTIEADKDAISREWLLNAFGLSEKTRKYGGDHSGYDTMMLYEIQDYIEDAPSVVPQPKEGEWIPDPDGGFKCSNCRAEEDEFIYGTGMRYVNGESEFCPNCGAKMFAKDINVPNKNGVEND